MPLRDGKVCDRLKIEIKVGQYVAYAVREGNHAEMKVGRVEGIEGQVIVVHGVSWGYGPDARLTRNLRSGKLSFAKERVVVLSWVPEEIRRLFEDIKTEPNYFHVARDRWNAATPQDRGKMLPDYVDTMSAWEWRENEFSYLPSAVAESIEQDVRYAAERGQA